MLWDAEVAGFSLLVLAQIRFGFVAYNFYR